MLHLGLIKDAAQAPAEYHRVFVRVTGSAQAEGPAATVTSWPERRLLSRGPQRFELCLDVSAGPEALDSWAPRLAETVLGLRWDRWWLDTASVASAVGLPMEEALAAWGRSFFGHYDSPDAAILLTACGERGSAMRAVRIWEDCFGHARYLHAYDFELHEMERRERRQERVAKVKAAIRPKFLAPKERAT